MNNNNTSETNTHGSDEMRQSMQFWFPPHNGHSLPVSMFQILVPRVDVRLDYENLHITLKELGWHPNAKALMRAINKIVNDLGIVVRIVAYADWDTLSHRDRAIHPRWGKRAWQRDLATMGVETRYLVSSNGKNMADMKIANDVRDLLEYNGHTLNTVEVIVLGTNDSDFRPVLETARQRQRRVVLLGVKGQMSQHLLHTVDVNDIYYIDKDLQLYHNQTPFPNQGRNPKSPVSNNKANGTGSSR